MSLLTGAIGSLLPKLGELLKEEYDLQKGVKKKIEKLSRELEAAHTVLSKIGDVPADQLDRQVKLWASEVREASYDMEDIVDTFLVRVEDDPNEPTEPHMLRRLRKKVGRLFKKSKARHNISSLIDEINEKLQEVAARRGRYTLDGIVAKPAAANTIDPRILNLYKRATELVGIEGPRDELINKLSLKSGDVDMPSTTKMKVLSIVGFGGLGKTTLAKAVYEHLNSRFECWAFVPVGQNPDIKKVLWDILMGLDKKKFMNLNTTMLDVRQLMDEIKEFINEKRCFIVIDDIWDEDSWELIRCALQDSNYASRFIITTRISKVASHADEVYKVQPLCHDDSEKLLLARISDGKGKNFGSLSVEAYEKLLKKCSGVPLAIITIASLLASKPEEDWFEIYNSIGFGHEDNDDVNNTRRILSFSYYDLPSHLKPCLLYLSVFPEDHKIEKNSLIWKWIAEGFITKEQAAAAGVGLFELGERYFNELINRNMIQAEPSKLDEGYINACSVHDMVLDLIRHLSSEENFVTILNRGERPKFQGTISHRLALQCVEENNAGQLANVAVEKVRSIFATRSDFCALCPRLPFLRVVEMVQRGEGVLDHLWSLLHLRYLKLERISNTRSTLELPREVKNLRFLQTLDVENFPMEEMPEEVGFLTQLLCLRANWITRVPAGLVSKLTSLQELSMRHTDEDNATTIMQFVKELGQLRELRVLHTYILDRNGKSIESALLESLGHMHNIQELKIAGFFPLMNWLSDYTGSVSYRQLHFLCFIGPRFYELPASINSSLAANLSYLELGVEVLKEQDMETLAKFPELSCLTLKLKSTEIVSIKLHTGYFQKLRLLKIRSTPIWFDLCGNECNSNTVASNTIMPSLESLEFDVHVRSLKDENLHLGFDKLFGFNNLGRSSLQRVRARIHCQHARICEVEEAKAALENAAIVHPNRPTFLSSRF